MRAKAGPGLKCPMEGKPREYITDSKAVEVPDTPYYRRMFSDGSLIEVVAAPQKVKGGDR